MLAQLPGIAGISISGMKPMLNGTGGLSGRTYFVQAGTNLTEPFNAQLRENLLSNGSEDSFPNKDGISTRANPDELAAAPENTLPHSSFARTWLCQRRNAVTITGTLVLLASRNQSAL